MVRYCFIMDCYVGIMEFESDGEITMTWEPDENLSELARRYKFYVDLSSTEAIMRFIGERVISDQRPDRAVWLAGIGASIVASPLEVFIKGHGVSINDWFWFDEVKSTKWWDEHTGRLIKEYGIE